jgi:asparagine synthase (glutamine-hydrolysing)
MCGICFYSRLSNQDERLDKFNSIKHRGPDNSSFIIKNGNFFGCHRLSIINPSDSGNQPLEYNSLVLVCNGQIYNYLELADKYNIQRNILRSDVDVILHLYENGLTIKDICNELDGVFAFVLYDTVKSQIFIGRDPVGVRPLFWSISLDAEIEAICSEVKGMPSNCSKVVVFPPNHCYSSLGGLEEYSDLYQNISYQLKEDIPLMSNAEITLTTDNEYVKYEILENEIDILREFIDSNLNVIKSVSYTSNNFDFSTLIGDSVNSEKDKIYELLEKSVIKRIENSDRPVAFLCSGGIDSSIVFCIAQKYLKENGRKIHAFSVEYDCSKSFDSFYVKMLMNEYRDEDNVDYTAVKFNWNDVLSILDEMPRMLESYDPNTIRASIPMYYLTKYLRENTDYKVFLSGEGADEIFMGYNYFNIDVDNVDSANSETKRLVRNLHMFDVLRADRMFAVNGLELRVPYLDRELVSYVFSLGGEIKLPRNGEEKPLLRDSVADKFPQLMNSKVLGRQKERLSDGCGFSYVPNLLNHICEGRNMHLTEKKEIEKVYYMNNFEKFYGKNNRHLIVKRELPSWCDDVKKVESNKNILSAFS